MEGRISRTPRYILPSLALLLALGAAAGCGNDAPPMGAALGNRDSLPVMHTRGVSKLISDSGVVRYKIVAEEWFVYDKTTPQRQVFPKGLFLERYDADFRPDLHITADTAYCYNQNLWELRGRVFVQNEANGTTFSTEELFWDTDRHRLYSNKHIHIITPDRDLQGDRFESNEKMTEYHVWQSSGFVPMPADGGAPAANTPPAPAPTQSEGSTPNDKAHPASAPGGESTQPAETDTIPPRQRAKPHRKQ